MILPDATQFLAQPYAPNFLKHIQDLDAEQLEVSAAGYFEKASSSLDRGDIESAVQDIARLDSMLNDIFLCLSRNLNDNKGFPDRARALRGRIERDKDSMREIGADFDEVLSLVTDDLEDMPSDWRANTPDMQRLFIKLSSMLHPLSHLLGNQYHRLYLPLSKKFPFFVRAVWIDGQDFDRSAVPDMLWLDLTDRAPQSVTRKQVTNADIAEAFAVMKRQPPFSVPVITNSFADLVKLAERAGRTAAFADYLPLFECRAESDGELAALADKLVSAFADKSVFQTYIIDKPVCGILSLQGLPKVPDGLYGSDGRDLLRIIKTRHKLCEWLDSRKMASYAAVLRIDFAGKEIEDEVLCDAGISDNGRMKALHLLQDIREKAAQYEALMRLISRRGEKTDLAPGKVEPDAAIGAKKGCSIWKQAVTLLSDIDFIAQTGARTPRKVPSCEITESFIRAAILHGCLELKPETVSVPTSEEKMDGKRLVFSGTFIFLPLSLVGINMKGLNEINIKPGREEQACIILFDLICAYILKTYCPQGATMMVGPCRVHYSSDDAGRSKRTREALFEPVTEAYCDDNFIFENIMDAAVRFFTNLSEKYGWGDLAQAVRHFANFPCYTDLAFCLLPKTDAVEVLSDGQNVYPSRLASITARYHTAFQLFGKIPVAATAITDMEDAGWIMKTMEAIKAGRVLHTCHFEILEEVARKINAHLESDATDFNTNADFS